MGLAFTEISGFSVPLLGVFNAMADLNATYRWGLTGCASCQYKSSPRLIYRSPSTPIINTLSDARSLIRFMRLRPWNDWNRFSELVARIDLGLATDRFLSVFNTT